jgi:hypothetical protein
MKKKHDRQNMPNAARHRPMGTITMSPEGWARLDAQRSDTPRGAYVEMLLDVVARGLGISRELSRRAKKS